MQKPSFQKHNIVVILSTITLFTMLGFQNCSSVTQFAGVPGGTIGESSKTATSTDQPLTDPNADRKPKQCEFQGNMFEDGYSFDAYQFKVVPSTQECVMESRVCENGGFTGSFVESDCSKAAAPPLQLNAVHTAGNRNFRVTTIGMNLTGVTCKVQFERSANDWADIAGSDRNCETNFQNVSLQLPSSDHWASEKFDSQGIRLRIVNSANSAIIGFIPETLKCYVSGGGTISTPDHDENCNYKWDDTGPNNRVCKIDNPVKGFNNRYNCPETIICDRNKTAQFQNMYWQMISDFYSDACMTSQFSRAISWGGHSQSPTGTLPFNELHPAGCQPHGTGGTHFRVNPSQWDESECEYVYQDGVLYY